MSGDEQSAERLPSETEASGVGEGTAPGTAPGRPALQTALEEVIRPLAIAGMLTCIAVSLTQLIMFYAPAWPGSFLVVLTFVVCLESIHAQRLVDRLRLRGADLFRFRFVELVVILLVVRFGVYLYYGLSRLMADMSSWSTDLVTFLDLDFIARAFLVVIFWVLAASLARSMQELEASAIERMPSVMDPDHYLRTTMPRHGRTDRQARLNRIVTVFFVGGAFLLFLSGFSRVDVRDMVLLQHSRSSGIILNALIYFVLGLLLISQAHYTILRANWELQGIPLLGRLGRRWLLLALAFLLIVAAISALLPVGYSVGLIDAISTAIRWALYTIFQVFFLFLFLISLVIGFFSRLFRGEQATPVPTPVPQPTPPPPPSMVEAGTPAWWLVARSLIFWAILTGVVGYSLYHFASDRWGLFKGLSFLRFFSWLGQLWTGLANSTERVVGRIRDELERRIRARSSGPGRPRWGYVALGRLTPRERVRYYYLSLLHRSAEEGFARPPHMTPLQYQALLAQRLPEAEPQVRELTDAFVEARYSEHSIDQQNATRAQRLWRLARRALQQLRRRRTAADRM